MSIRTKEQLSDRLAGELAWRKKELSDLAYYLDLSDPGPISRRRVLGRCGVAILYAHWEGFVKLAAQYFLEFVTMQRVLNKELHPNLLTLSMRRRVAFSPETRKSSEYGKFTDFFLRHMDDHATLKDRNVIDTESNLSSKVLREIIWCLGVDYSPYETSEKFIDSHLLARRNHVAHGEAMEIDPNEYHDMRDRLIGMMTSLKNQLENSATMESYRVTSR